MAMAHVDWLNSLLVKAGNWAVTSSNSRVAVEGWMDASSLARAHRRLVMGGKGGGQGGGVYEGRGEGSRGEGSKRG